MRKVLKYQSYIWFHNKSVSLGMLVFFLLCIGVMLAYSFAYPLEAPEKLTSEDKAEMRIVYEQEREKARAILAYKKGEGELPEGTSFVSNKDYQKEYDYYDYLLKTNTFREDYSLERRDEIIVSNTLVIASVLLPILAILLTYYLASTATSPSSKNALAAPMPRKTLFRGKILSAWMFVAGMLVLSYLCPLIASLCEKHVHLFYGKTGYYTLPCAIATFLPRAIALLIAVFFWSGITLLCSAAKKRRSMLIIPLCLFIARQLVYYVSRTFLDLYLYVDAVAFLRFADHRISWFGRSEGAIGWIGLGISFVLTIGVCIASFILYPRFAERLDEVKNAGN